jgi:hypothetical protein
VGCGLALGVAITTLNFAHNFPRAAAQDNLGFLSFASLLLEWCGQGILLALIVGLAERWKRPRELCPWQLALAVLVGAVAAVLIWQTFILTVLRDLLGIRLFRDHLGAPVIWIIGVYFQIWVLLFSAVLPRRCTHRGASERACWAHCARRSSPVQLRSTGSRKQDSPRCTHA